MLDFFQGLTVFVKDLTIGLLLDRGWVVPMWAAIGIAIYLTPDILEKTWVGIAAWIVAVAVHCAVKVSREKTPEQPREGTQDALLRP